jgi:hypothetical protein
MNKQNACRQSDNGLDCDAQPTSQLGQTRTNKHVRVGGSFSQKQTFRSVEPEEDVPSGMRRDFHGVP